MFCRAGSVDEMTFTVGVSGVECAAGEGRIYSGSGEGAAGSGLLVAWAVVLGFNFVGSGLRIGSWGSSTTSSPLPSSVSNGEITSFFCLHFSTTMVLIKHSSSGFTSSW